MSLNLKVKCLIARHVKEFSSERTSGSRSWCFSECRKKEDEGR